MSSSAEGSSKNIVWHASKVTEKNRIDQFGHCGAVLWFTGLSGSGKSTLANEVEKQLVDQKVRAYVLDGDNIRHGLNRDLGFTPEAREENIRRISEVSRLFCDAGMIILTAFISPYRKDREAARSLVPEERFVEIFVDCPIEKCEERDPKGLYQKARAGEIAEFTGVSAPYEAPASPEIQVRTDQNTLEACAQEVIQYLKQKAIIS